MSIRNEECNLSECLDSIFGQSMPPDQICIIDDGSTDNSVSVIEQFYPISIIQGIQFVVFHTYNKEKDYTRLGSLWNKGLDPEFDYHMIMNGDILLDHDYVQKIMDAMESDGKLVVASGDSGELRDINQPWGACRLVKNDWFFKHVQRYPYKLGYESYILELALNLEYRVDVFKIAKFRHLRPLGKSRSFVEEGRQMRNLGYHPLYALLRIISQRSFKKSVQMLWGYAFYSEKSGNPYYERFDKQFSDQLSKRQFRKLGKLVANLF